MGLSKIKLGVSGAFGKMGARILALASCDADFAIALALERLGHPQLGEKVFGVDVASDRSMIKDADCLVDFSSPEATLENLSFAARFKKAMVIGTTGFTDGQKKMIGAFAKKIPVVLSPNMSIGVNVLFELVRQAARSLPVEYKAYIVESHHVHKKDAPSGTAKFLAGIVKEERGVECADVKSIRKGEIIGDHDVIFECPSDTIVLRHNAKTRDIFAQGALQAAKFVVKKKRGLFGMADVLKGLKK
ncbi:MAG TPA: 4-hydroxy-tetrahydrodipicolinate reductase [Candidatus Omnitrophica bacterium]|nr:4-hydroxy-tetrahydrodipicolinate reductase [Candidatus Omnitrophota bacterium]